MTKIIIEGMMCMHCVARVKGALEKLGTNVSVDLNEGFATLETKASDEELKKSIEELEFEVKEIIHD